MLPILGGLISGGASLLGSMFTANTSAANTQANILAQQNAQSNTEAFNAQQAELNREFQAGQVNQAQNYNQESIAQQEQFQTAMSNTAYQRASADMQKAGLNPMMMFGSGGAASTPSGAAGSIPAASGSSASVGVPNMALSQRTSPFGNLGDVIAKGIGSAGAVQELTKQGFVTDQAQQSARGEKAKADQAEAEAEKARLGIPQARLDSMEANTRLGLPKEDIATHATSAYKYGDWLGKFSQPFEAGTNLLERAVNNLIDKATGPTGQAMWDKAREAAGNTFGTGKYIGPGGKLLDFKDFPNIRKTTLNDDYR